VSAAGSAVVRGKRDVAIPADRGRAGSYADWVWFWIGHADAVRVGITLGPDGCRHWLYTDLEWLQDMTTCDVVENASEAYEQAGFCYESSDVAVRSAPCDSGLAAALSECEVASRLAESGPALAHFRLARPGGEEDQEAAGSLLGSSSPPFSFWLSRGRTCWAPLLPSDVAHGIRRPSDSWSAGALRWFTSLAWSPGL
jgi:hypothetical protein